MDEDVLAALNGINAQRIDGLLVLLEAMGQIKPSEQEVIDPLKESLISLREAMKRGEDRDEDWKRASELVEQLYARGAESK